MRVSTFVALVANAMASSHSRSMIEPLNDSRINIFVASYNNTVTSLALTPRESPSWTLSTTDVSHDCGVNPSWLTFDISKRRLYCLNEGINQPSGSVTELSVTRSGSFSTIANRTLLAGPVSGTLSQRGNSALLFIAHYR